MFLIIKMGLHFLSAVYLEKGDNQVFWLNLNLIASAVLIIVACIIKFQNSKVPIPFLIGMAVLACVQDFMAICHLKEGKKGGEIS